MSDTITEQAEKTLTVEAPATDDMFQITKTRLANPICKWSDCTDGVDPFGNVYDLVQHVSSHIIPQLDIAPVQREYTCQWEECRKVYKKRQALLTHIQDMHTGNFIMWLPIILTLWQSHTMPKNLVIHRLTQRSSPSQ